MRTKLLFVLLLLFPVVFLSALPTSAHEGPRNSNKEYEITVELNGLSIYEDPNLLTFNDQNIIGGADAIFQYEIDPTSPDHDKVTGITDTPVQISSGESVTFDTPVQIYSHTTCSCDQEIESNMKVFDYAPVKSTIIGLFKKGVSLTGSFLTTGPTGVMIDLLGEALNWVGQQIIISSLTDEQKAAYEVALVISNSETIGVLEDSQQVTCATPSSQFTNPISLEERDVGEITYTISATETGNECPIPIEEGGANTGDNEGGNEDGITDYDCDEATGKVRVYGQYVCPSNSDPFGNVCKCRVGYEWAFLDNRCEGCQKTRSERCLEAVRAILDDATGTIEADLEIQEDKYIHWDAGGGSCKNQSAVITDFSRDIQTYLPDHNAMCTNLKFLRGEGRDNCGLDFYFQFIEDE